MILQVAESKGYKHPKTSIKTHRNKKNFQKTPKPPKFYCCGKAAAFFSVSGAQQPLRPAAGRLSRAAAALHATAPKTSQVEQ
jgi:hypothetical protein